MKRNNISKIALLTSLLVINTNVKGFYQCVPKKTWIQSIIKEKNQVTLLKKLPLFVNENGDINFSEYQFTRTTCCFQGGGFCWYKFVTDNKVYFAKAYGKIKLERSGSTSYTNENGKKITRVFFSIWTDLESDSIGQVVLPTVLEVYRSYGCNKPTN